MKNIAFFLTACIACSAAVSYSAAGQASYPLLARGEYLSVYAFPEMDTQRFLEKMEFGRFFQGRDEISEEDSPADLTAKMCDAVYLEVSDTLGISAYAFEGNIKIFPDRQALSREFYALFERDFPERAFYLHENSTLYISFEDMTLGMLAHEIAHMIMSHYFVIPPPPKLQEILSGYAEYHFQKMLKTPLMD